METGEKLRMIKYCHWGASLCSLLLLVCGILSLLMLILSEPLLDQVRGSMSGVDRIMYSRIPSYLAVVLAAILCSVCFLQRIKLTVASVILSWLLSCLLILLTMMSIVAPTMRMQHQAS